MSTNKTNYFQLHSWADTDLVDVSEINQNFTTIDTKLHDLDNVNTNQDTRLTNVENGKQKTIFIQSSAPTSGVLNDLWVDTNANLLRRYNGTKWGIVNSVWVSSVAPSSPTAGDLWLDTAGYNLKMWDGTSQWKKVNTYVASEISIADAGNVITATNVEGALQELATNKRDKTDVDFTGRGTILVDNMQLPKDKWFQQGAGFDANNADLKNLNGLYWNDICDVLGEGLNFLKSGKTMGSTTQADYDNVKVLDGILYVNDPFQAGNTSITPVANTPTSKTITFKVPYTTAPIVTATAITGGAGSNVQEVSVNNVTTTGFDIVIYRTNTIDTWVNWTAMPKTQ